MKISIGNGYFTVRSSEILILFVLNQICGINTEVNSV